MKRVWTLFSSVLFLCVMFHLDGSVTRFLNASLDLPIHVSSHLFFIGLVYVLPVLSSGIVVLLSFCLGLLYDCYFLDFYPVMMVVLPLIAYLGKVISKKLSLTMLSRFLLNIILVFGSELGAYLLAYGYGMMSYWFFPFIIGSLAPTLLLTSLNYFLIVPLLERLCRIMTLKSHEL